jgi:autophagy-related protein 5
MNKQQQQTLAHHIWEGMLPIQVELDKEELEAAGITLDHFIEPYFMLIRRCNYLPVITPQIIELLIQRHLPFIGDETDIWYSFGNIPLKWHYPIGLLYDLYVGKKSEIPWKLIVHTRGYPDEHLLRSPLPSIDHMRDLYMGLIKESDFLRHGSVKRVMKLSKQDQTQLWTSLCSGDFNAFWTVNQQLVWSNSSEILIDTASLPRHVPLRLYLPDSPVIQEPVQAIDDQGK